MVSSPYFEALLPLVAAGLSLIASVGWWLVLLPRLALAFLLFSLLVGQALRLPLPGQGGGILVSDIAAVFVLLSALFVIIRRKSAYNLQATTYCLLFVPFLLWSSLTLIIETSFLSLSESLVALSYWLRLSAYLLLLPALILILSSSEGTWKFLQKGFLITVLLLTLLGFTQLAILPDLQVLSSFGWDPHEGRLVSTWLDPNFFGVFLVMSLFTAAAAFQSVNRKSSLAVIMVLATLALIATKSRSSMLAITGALILVSPFLYLRGKAFSTNQLVRLFVAALTAGGLVILAILILGSRVWGLVQFDPTVALRAESLTAAWQHVIEPHGFIGVGYNAYQFAAREAGLIEDFSIHSRAGVDNSWALLWATAGLSGLILFLMPWVWIGFILLRQWMLKSHVLSLAALTSLLALFIHSQFLNSFLYGHLLITLEIITALALTSKATSQA